jgi:hypothetical protein
MISRKRSFWLAQVAACAVLSPTFSCSRPVNAESRPLFDAAHSVALDGTISEGIIHTKSTADDVIWQEIASQLQYNFGQLNGIDSLADSSKTEINILGKEDAGNGLQKVRYSAKLFVAWDKNRAVPASYELILPGRGDVEGLNLFLETYGKDATETCRKGGSGALNLDSFWYYYRPEKSACALKKKQNIDATLVSYVKLDLAPSNDTTQNKAPEYGAVWEDGQLIVTAVFGKAHEGAMTTSDVGIAAYNQTYSAIVQKFGKPVVQSVELGEGAIPGAENTYVFLSYDTPQGHIEFNLFLVDVLSNTSEEFKKNFSTVTGCGYHLM